jgi:hypothetical protein
MFPCPAHGSLLSDADVNLANETICRDGTTRNPTRADAHLLKPKVSEFTHATKDRR